MAKVKLSYFDFQRRTRRARKDRFVDRRCRVRG